MTSSDDEDSSISPDRPRGMLPMFTWMPPPRLSQGGVATPASAMGPPLPESESQTATTGPQGSVLAPSAVLPDPTASTSLPGLTASTILPDPTAVTTVPAPATPPAALVHAAPTAQMNPTVTTPSPRPSLQKTSLGSSQRSQRTGTPPDEPSTEIPSLKPRPGPVTPKLQMKPGIIAGGYREFGISANPQPAGPRDRRESDNEANTTSTESAVTAPSQPSQPSDSAAEAEDPQPYVWLRNPTGGREKWYWARDDSEALFWIIARGYYASTMPYEAPPSDVRRAFSSEREKMQVLLVYYETGSVQTPIRIRADEKYAGMGRLILNEAMTLKLQEGDPAANWYIVKHQHRITLRDGTRPDVKRSYTVEHKEGGPHIQYKDLVQAVRTLFPRRRDEGIEAPSVFEFANERTKRRRARGVDGEFAIPTEDPFEFCKKTLWFMTDAVVFIWPKGFTPDDPIASASLVPRIELAQYPRYFDTNRTDTILKQIIGEGDEIMRTNDQLRSELKRALNAAQKPQVESEAPSLGEQVMQIEKEVRVLRTVIGTAQKCFSGSCTGTGQLDIPDPLNEAVDLSYIFWDHWWDNHSARPQVVQDPTSAPPTCQYPDCHAKLEWMEPKTAELHMSMHEFAKAKLKHQEHQTLQVQHKADVAGSELVAALGRLEQTDEILRRDAPDLLVHLRELRQENAQAPAGQEQEEEIPTEPNTPPQQPEYVLVTTEEYQPGSAESDSEERSSDDGKAKRTPQPLPADLQSSAEGVIEEYEKRGTGFDDTNAALQPFFHTHLLRFCNVCLVYCGSYSQMLKHCEGCETAPWNFVTRKAKDGTDPTGVPFKNRLKAVPSATAAKKRKRGSDGDDGAGSSKRNKRSKTNDGNEAAATGTGTDTGVEGQPGQDRPSTPTNESGSFRPPPPPPTPRTPPAGRTTTVSGGIGGRGRGRLARRGGGMSRRAGDS